MNEELFAAEAALTFDDVLIVPAFSETLPAYVDLRCRVAGNMTLNIPRCSPAVRRGQRSEKLCSRGTSCRVSGWAEGRVAWSLVLMAWAC